MAAEIPAWVEDLKWVIVAAALALAYIGPRLLRPIIDKWNASLPNINQTLGQQHLAVVGAAFADRESLNQLVESVNRLCDILEERTERENAVSQEAKARKMMQDLLRELREVEHPHTTDRDKR